MRRAGVVMALAIVVTTAASAAAMTQSEVESRLACQCGCGLTVHTCDHLQCSFGVPVKDDIAAALAAGETGEAIIARYVAEYGEKVLSAPTREGFNLVAWLAPYVALTFGAILVLVAVRRMASGRGSNGPPAGEHSAAPAAVDPALRDRLRQELEELDR